MQNIQIIANAVKARALTEDRKVKTLLSELMSYQVLGAEHSSTFAAGHWDGRSSLFHYNTGVFPSGYLRHARALLQKNGYNVVLREKQAPTPLGPEVPQVDSFPADPRYDYQMETVNKLVQHRRMIAQIATGGGKSRIAKLAVARLKLPSMFLTTRNVLAEQMKSHFEQMGARVGFIGDGIWEPRRDVNVCMVQTLAAALFREQASDKITPESLAASEQRRKRAAQFLSYMQFVMLEEAHEVGGHSYYEILNLCENAHYRLALTATPFMKEDGEANARLLAATGPIAMRVTEETLINRGILATPIFKYRNSPKTTGHRRGSVSRTTSYSRAVQYGIVHHSGRNFAIADEAADGVRYGLPVMILVQRKEHGVVLRDILRNRGMRSEFIWGDSSKKERRRALGDLKIGQLQVLIGSTILDVGVDVPAVGMVILAGGGKAEVALRQRIGRGLREKKHLPNFCFIVDFDDAINEHLAMHAATRRAVVEQTPGFGEHILPPGAPFPYERLGFALAA